jgi:glycosyltransferase involved in cell wall biosynthesis
VGMLGKWICCQIGARQHYSVPFSLYSLGCLDSLITDMWCEPGSPVARMNRRLAGRFHAGLRRIPVYAWNKKAVAFELLMFLRRMPNWSVMETRNELFQRNAVRILARRKERDLTLHSFSYASLHIFELAKKNGWRSVMQQIDPGPLEDRIVSDIYSQHPDYRGRWHSPSPTYWEKWRRECELADVIVVNSRWSEHALRDAGIPEKRIRLIPLAYVPSNDARVFIRQYPVQFSSSRPLRVLFLGLIDLRKGVLPLLESAELLSNEPIEFWFAGPLQFALPNRFRNYPKLRWFGAIPRTEVQKLYREADVFVFPTFSDGFGLTQLEAQSWKLPVIATRFCGDVVDNGKNGIILNDISKHEIALALQSFLRRPQDLRLMSSQSGVAERFGLHAVGSAFRDLTYDNSLFD